MINIIIINEISYILLFVLSLELHGVFYIYNVSQFGLVMFPCLGATEKDSATGERRACFLCTLKSDHLMEGGGHILKVPEFSNNLNATSMTFCKAYALTFAHLAYCIWN